MIRNICLLLGLLTLFSCENKPEMIHFEMSPCQDGYDLFRFQERIVSIDREDDQAIIEIAVKDNCCIGELGSVAVKGDTIILHYGIPKGSEDIKVGEIFTVEVCSCNCCFHFNYTISGLEDKDYSYIVRGLEGSRPIKYYEHAYKIVEPRYDIIDGDTVNYHDKFGFKQGWFVSKTENGLLRRKLLYEDDIPVFGLYNQKFFDNGKLYWEIHVLKEGYYEMKEYDREGVLVQTEKGDNVIDLMTYIWEKRK